MRLHGVASSTTKDLHGDTILESAISDMESAANNNLTIFLNHSYNVPEDVGGSVEKAKSQTRGVDQNGDPNVDLDFDILVNESNPRAVSTFEAIERGTKLGLSIGAMIPEGGAKRNKDGTYIIEHLDLMETSLVGIPANPRSWVEYAVKAINNKTIEKDAKAIPIGQPTVTLDGSHYTITGDLEHTSTTNSGSVTWVNLGATCPDCGGTKSAPQGNCGSTYHKAVEATDVEDAKVTLIEIDTGEESSGSDTSSDDAPASQEASTSQPDAEDGLLDETADGDDAQLGDDITQSVVVAAGETSIVKSADLESLLNLVASTTRELVDARQAEAEAISTKAIIVKERDQAVEERRIALTATHQILKRLAEQPLVRKTALAEADADFRARFGGVYDDDFLKVLERNSNAS